MRSVTARRRISWIQALLSSTKAGSPSRDLLVFHNSGSRQRFEDIRHGRHEVYPRQATGGQQLSCREFFKRFTSQGAVAGRLESEQIILHGRVGATRSAGARLFFVDIMQDGQRIQGMCNLQELSGSTPSLAEFRDCFRRVHRGDNLQIEGVPYKTSTGELSILMKELPRILSPCLARFPTKLEDVETRIRARHVDFIVNPRMADLVRLRSEVVQHIRQFLLDDGQLEVQTPIMSDTAGGAVARSFQTRATEFPDRKIELRIAPELWLKRLIIGGFERVFEIGPSFRNEGLDATHNPEFTTCEFYRTYTDLPALMHITESLLGSLAEHIQRFARTRQIPLELDRLDFSAPFKSLDFITGLEMATGRRLPPLNEDNAVEKVATVLGECGIPLHDSPSLPQMLDRLSAVYLEPQCRQPTFIINHPECLSPLAKSFIHPETGQRVSARAELFVNQQEIVNTYEEENSPVAQREKFFEQLKYQPQGSSEDVNESYLEALEWGLPPTGGWGGGIERICMLMTATARIGDVLPFGTLKNVVALGSARQPLH